MQYHTHTLSPYQFHTNKCLETSTNCFVQLHSFKYESMIWYPYQSQTSTLCLEVLPPSAFTIHTCQSFVYKSDWYYTMGLPSHFIVELYQLQPCIFTTILIHHSHLRKLTATDILNRCGINQQILLITLGSSNDDHLLQLKINTTSSHLLCCQLAMSGIKPWIWPHYPCRGQSIDWIHNDITCI